MIIKKYKKIEFTEVLSSELEGGGRLDADFYDPKYLKVIKSIKNKSNIRLKEFGTLIIHPTEIKRIYTDKGKQILLAQNIRNNELDFSTAVFMPDEIVNQFLQRNKLNGYDIVMTRSGANYGQTACYLGEKNQLYACADCLIIRLSTECSLFISTFLNSKYGKLLLERGSYGMAQPHIAPPYLYSVNIPPIKKTLSKLISEIIIKANELKNAGENTYNIARDILYSELGIKNWQPKKTDFSLYNIEFNIEETINQKLFTETIVSNRFDADYFQPKYDELIQILKRRAKYIQVVKTIRSFNRRGKQPLYFDNGTLDVINSQHITETQLDYENFEKTEEVMWNNVKEARVFKNDILIYTTGANIGRTNVYLEEKKALASNHVNILRINEENPIYVGFVLNSLIGRMQTEKMKTGSAQPELYPKAIDQFIIPFIKENKQEEISMHYYNSLALRNQYKALLQISVNAMELFIEKNENESLEWLRKELKKIGVEL